MNQIIERLIEAGLILAIVFVLAGCNTVKGAAEDTAWLLDTVAKNISPE